MKNDFQSDEELIASYRKGSEKSVNELLERYKPLVLKKANAMFIVGGDKDDLIQEGMIGLYEAVKGYDSEKKVAFSYYASTCINNRVMTAITRANRKKYEPLNESVSYDAVVVNDSQNKEGRIIDNLSSGNDLNPEKMLIDKEYYEELKKKLINSLSPFEKQVFDLYFDEMDYKQIADVLNSTPKMVDNAIQRIKKKAAMLKS